MKILAIETSCDETALSLAECIGSKKKNNFPFGFKVISEVLFSQAKIHKKWGGVYPYLARREHQKNLIPLLSELLKKTRQLKIKDRKSKEGTNNPKIKEIKEILGKEKQIERDLIPFLESYQKPKIDLIAVTSGPGLEPCLWTGINFAKTLGIYWDLAVMPINHIEAHIFANWLTPVGENSKLFPAISLVVSGGHTQLIFMKDFGNYKIVGETLDDAAGEAFDKIGKIVGLPYPGGPLIAQTAKQWNSKINNAKLKITLPRPMLYSKNYDFSFSGLKTAVLYDYKKRPKNVRESKNYIVQMAHEAQKAIVDVLTEKTIKAAKEFNCRTIILGGGVAANDELKKEFKRKLAAINYKINFLAPKKGLCTDNAQMIAFVACYYWTKKRKIKKRMSIKASSNLYIAQEK